MIVDGELGLWRNVRVGEHIAADDGAVGRRRVAYEVSTLGHQTIGKRGHELSLLDRFQAKQRVYELVGIFRRRCCRRRRRRHRVMLRFDAFQPRLAAVPSDRDVERLALEVGRHVVEILGHESRIAVVVEREVLGAGGRAALALHVVDEAGLGLEEAVVVGDLVAGLYVTTGDDTERVLRVGVRSHHVVEDLVAEAAVRLARVVEQVALVVVLLLHERDGQRVHVVAHHVRVGAHEVVELGMAIDDVQQLVASEQRILGAALAVPDAFALLDRLHGEYALLRLVVVFRLLTANFDFLEEHHLALAALMLFVLRNLLAKKKEQKKKKAQTT